MDVDNNLECRYDFECNLSQDSHTDVKVLEPQDIHLGENTIHLDCTDDKKTSGYVLIKRPLKQIKELGTKNAENKFTEIIKTALFVGGVIVKDLKFGTRVIIRPDGENDRTIWKSWLITYSIKNDPVRFDAKHVDMIENNYKNIQKYAKGAKIPQLY
ncbi:MAG: hypothetical protein MPI93_04055 [Nitrosopumilus sp.]|nr:hypothetical protein [Nitrosopumilus sp.]